MTIDRTGHAAARRAEGSEGIHTDTVASDPSAVRNAEGARLAAEPLFLLRGSRPIRGSYADRKGETAMPDVTASAPVRPSTAPPSATAPYKKRAIPQAVRREVCIRAGAVFGHVVNIKCAYCPRVGHVSWRYTYGWPQIADLELDHVIPERHGGPSTADNIVLACRRCNRRKGARQS